MMKPLISVIVPVYKTEKYIARCINSILCQSYENIELILVDDGSPDKSGVICDDFGKRDSRVKVVHKENGGASSARNIGLQIASGEYLEFVDSDDWIEQDAFEKMYSLILENNAQMVISDLQIVSKGKKHKQALKTKISVWDKKECLDHFFRIHGEMDNHSVCGRLIKSDLMEEFRFIEGRMNEDIHSSYYLAAKCNRTVYTNKIFYNYYKNVDGVTNSKFTKKKLDLLYIWDVVSKMASQMTPEYVSVCAINYKRAEFTLLTQMNLNGYDKTDDFLNKTKKELKKAVRVSYWDLMRWKMPFSRKVLLTLEVLC